jgi:hypothetical protein
MRRLQQIRTAPEFSRRKAVADLGRGKGVASSADPHSAGFFKEECCCGFEEGRMQFIP